MATINLTNEEVKKIRQPESGQEFTWDSKLKGFGVRATLGSKTYIVEARVKGMKKRVSIAGCNEITVDQARKIAMERLAQMGRGENPNAVKAAEKARGITLAEVFGEYKSSRKLRESTLKAYEGSMRRCFSDWLDTPISEITKR